MAEKYKGLKEAVEKLEECDPTDCDCSSCPIGDLKMQIFDAGVDLNFSACSLLQLLDQSMEDDK